MPPNINAEEQSIQITANFSTKLFRIIEINNINIPIAIKEKLTSLSGFLKNLLAFTSLFLKLCHMLYK